MESSEAMMTETVGGARQKLDALRANIGKIIRGKDREIDKVLTCLIAGGHILMEDLPGLGKTSMAKALAYSIHGGHTGGKAGQDEDHVEFKRIQFTPDLLPMDLLGTYVFDDRNKEFIFKPGPLFSNIVLADEINRASPKVQSALLECMAENQISIGDQSYPLDAFFFVIATQNPIEFEGTYPLPAAQLDRFFMKIRFGYAAEDKELEIYRDYLQINQIPKTVSAVIEYDDIIKLRGEAEQVQIHPEIIQSVSNIVRRTREHGEIRLGASTRGGIIFLRCLRAFALLHGRSFVIEDDVKELASGVLLHRMLFKNPQDGPALLQQITGQEINRLAALKLS